MPSGEAGNGERVSGGPRLTRVCPVMPDVVRRLVEHGLPVLRRAGFAHQEVAHASSALRNPASWRVWTIYAPSSTAKGSAWGGGPVEFDRVRSPSGNMIVCHRQFWMGPHRAGTTARIWVGCHLVSRTTTQLVRSIKGQRPRTATYGRTHLGSRRRRPWRSPAFAGPFLPSRRGRAGAVAGACCAAGDRRGVHS